MIDSRISPHTDWLRLAADRRPEYLNVALLGIQRLPAIRDEALQLTALLRHAASLPHDQALADFDHRYAALRGRYPRAPAYWQPLLAQALAKLQAIKRLRKPH